jgi:hypothetical protein
MDNRKSMRYIVVGYSSCYFCKAIGAIQLFLLFSSHAPCLGTVGPIVFVYPNGKGRKKKTKILFLFDASVVFINSVVPSCPLLIARIVNEFPAKHRIK